MRFPNTRAMFLVLAAGIFISLSQRPTPRSPGRAALIHRPPPVTDDNGTLISRIHRQMKATNIFSTTCFFRKCLEIRICWFSPTSCQQLLSKYKHLMLYQVLGKNWLVIKSLLPSAFLINLSAALDRRRLFACLINFKVMDCEF